MSQDTLPVDDLTTDLPGEEQNKDDQQADVLTETPEEPKQDKTAKRFEKLLKQRNEAKKEAEELKQRLEEKDSRDESQDVTSVVKQELENYFRSKEEREQRDRQEREQRDQLFREYPEAKDAEADIVELAKAHPTVPYEGILRMVKPELFAGGTKKADPSGSTLSKVKPEKDLSQLSDDEFLQWGNKMAGK